MSGFGINYYNDGSLGVTFNGGEIIAFDEMAIEADALELLVRALNARVDTHIIRDWNGTDAPYWIG